MDPAEAQEGPLLSDAERLRFEQLVLPHLDSAYNLARWLLRSEADAQDVAQEAMLRALRFFPGFHGGDPRAWLLKIVRNASYTWLESHRRVEFLAEWRADGLQAAPNVPGRDGAGPGGSEAVPPSSDAPASVLKRTATCLVCGRGFSVNPCHAKAHRFCSGACRARWHRARRDPMEPQHPMEGVTP